MREIQACADGRAIPVSDRRDLIIREGISVKCYPISQFRQPIFPVHSRAAITGIICRTGKPIRSDPAGSGEQTLRQPAERQGHSWATHDGCARKTKFEIPRRFESNFLTMNKWL